MIGLDTSIVVRYLVQDDPDQSAAASALIEELTETDPGYISLVTVVELYWVLRRAYEVGPGRCTELLEGLPDAWELRVGQEGVVRAALSNADGLDFADAVIAELGRTAGCEHTVTVDRRAAGGRAMRLLPTRHPNP